MRKIKIHYKQQIASGHNIYPGPKAKDIRRDTGTMTDSFF